MARRLTNRASQAGERALRRQQLGLAPGSKREAPVNLETEIAEQLQQLSGSPFAPDFGPAPERPDFQTDREVPFLADLERSIASIRRRETATTPGELAGLEGMFEAADPSLRLEKAREFINTIVGPQQEAAAVKAGFGRGPAALEATTRAGAELALPIVTEAGRQQALANQFKVALEHARLGRMESKDRAVFEAVLNKVQQGQTTAGLNAQQRNVLAQFNLGAAGLRSEQGLARSNVGLSTQDRTLTLLNLLRTMRTSQAQLNSRTGGSLTGGGGTTSLFPGGVVQSKGIPGFPASETTKLFGSPEFRALRTAQTTAAQAAGRQATTDFARFFSAPSPTVGSLASKVSGTAPSATARKTLFNSSVFA